MGSEPNPLYQNRLTSSEDRKISLSALRAELNDLYEDLPEP
jgi:hypothetical protein